MSMRSIGFAISMSIFSCLIVSLESGKLAVDEKA